MTHSNGSNPPPQTPSGRALITIVLICLLSFAGSVLSDYYMDDFMFVVDAKGDSPPDRHYVVPFAGAVTDPGKPGSKSVSIFEIIPTSFWLVTDQLIADPGSGSWAYHLWNLILHTLTACAAYFAGREVLRAIGFFQEDKFCGRTALVAALLFGSHPLCSEPVNYAKCLNHVTEALFGLLSVWQGCRWLQRGGNRAAAGCLGFLLLATFSYFPGLAITLAWLVLLAGAVFLQRRQAFGKLSWQLKVGLAVVLLAGAVLYTGALLGQQKHWSDLRMAHILTQSRVFWDYLGMVVVPAGLCSDHHIAWSVPGKDGAAAVALGAIVVTVLSLVIGAWKAKRPFLRGLCLLTLMGIVPLLLRFLYINSEVMVEYRAYSALPWLMLVPACILVTLFKERPRVLIGVTAPVIITFALASHNRTSVWSSRELLLTDVLERYPLHHRARTQLQAYYGETGDSAGVFRLHDEITAAVAGLERWNGEHAGRQYEMKETSMAFIHSAQWMIYSIADRDGSRAALEWAEKTIPLLEHNFPHHFRGDLSLQNPKNLPSAWPVLMARNTVRKHGAEIDAARRSVPPSRPSTEPVASRTGMSDAKY